MVDQITKIPKGWQMTTLGEVAKILIGRTPPRKELEWFSTNKEDISWISIKDLGQINTYVKNTSEYLKREAIERFRIPIIPRDTIVLSFKLTVGRVGIAHKNMTSNEAIAQLQIRDKTINNFFLFYYLKSFNFNSIGSTSSIATAFNSNSIKNISIFFPEFNEQIRIVKMLRSLDDKIELLREQNKTLEAIAQAIFKEWFVNFNFPGATGEMIDSELGKIPGGWRVEKFGDIFKIEYGKSNKEFDKDGEFPVYGAGGIMGYSSSTDYKNFQVIVGCRGTCGNITLIYEDSKITHNSLIITNEWSKFYSYLFLQIIDIKRAITGSTQPQITIGDLGNIQIYIPEKHLIKLFSENINSVFKKIRNNNSQIQTLSKLRDTLLPKLMKGEVRIKGFWN